MKVEVDVLGSPSLIVQMVFVDVKQHLRKKTFTGSSLQYSSSGQVSHLMTP